MESSVLSSLQELLSSVRINLQYLKKHSFSRIAVYWIQRISGLVDSIDSIVLSIAYNSSEKRKNFENFQSLSVLLHSESNLFQDIEIETIPIEEKSASYVLGYIIGSINIGFSYLASDIADFCQLYIGNEKEALEKLNGRISFWHKLLNFDAVDVQRQHNEETYSDKSITSGGWFMAGWYSQSPIYDKTFLSHRGPDIKMLLSKHLQISAYRTVAFLDCLTVPERESCRRFIYRNLLECKSAIFLITTKFLDSPWCVEEACIWEHLRIRPADKKEHFQTFLFSNSRSSIEQLKSLGIFCNLSVTYFNSPEEMAEETMKKLRELHRNPRPYIEPPVGYLRRPIFDMKSILQEVPVYEHLGFANRLVSEVKKFQEMRSTIIPRHIEWKEFYNFTSKIEQQARKNICLTNDAELILKLIPVARAEYASPLIESVKESLIQHIQLIGDLSLEFCLEDSLFSSMKIYSTVLGFLGCAMQCMKKVMQRLLLEDDSDDTSITDLRIIAMCNFTDYLNVMQSVQDLIKMVRIFDFKWTSQQWMILHYSLQGQKKYRRRVLIRGSDQSANDNLSLILSVREIILVFDSAKLSFLQEILLFLWAMKIDSRTILFCQTEQDLGSLKNKCGEFCLEWVPHFTTPDLFATAEYFAKRDNKLSARNFGAQ